MYDLANLISTLSEKDKERFGASFLPMVYSDCLMEIFSTKDKALIEGVIKGLITDACALSASLVGVSAEHCAANPTEGAYIVQEVRDYIKGKIRKHFDKGENDGQGNTDSGIPQE